MANSCPTLPQLIQIACMQGLNSIIKHMTRLAPSISLRLVSSRLLSKKGLGYYRTPEVRHWLTRYTFASPIPVKQGSCGRSLFCFGSAVLFSAGCSLFIRSRCKATWWLPSWLCHQQTNRPHDTSRTWAGLVCRSSCGPVRPAMLLLSKLCYHTLRTWHCSRR